MAAKFSATAPPAVSLFFPDGTEVDDDDTVEVRAERALSPQTTLKP